MEIRQDKIRLKGKIKLKFDYYYINFKDSWFITPLKTQDFKRVFREGMFNLIWKDNDKDNLFFNKDKYNISPSEFNKDYRLFMECFKPRKPTSREAYLKGIESNRERVKREQIKRNNKKQDTLNKLPIINEFLKDYDLVVTFNPSYNCLRITLK